MRRLLEDSTWRVDGQRRVTRRSHEVYRVMDQAGVDSAGEVSVSWSPWHERRPVVRARVINKGGRVFVLSEEALQEETPEGQKRMFSDRRRLRAPLPALRVGSVVEVVIEVSEHQPAFTAARNLRLWMEGSERVSRWRASVETPAGTSVKAAFRNVDAKVAKARFKRDGQAWVRRVWSVPSPEPYAARETYQPDGRNPYRRLTVSVGGSWGDVASEYAGYVEDVLKTPLPEEARAAAAEVAKASSRQERAAAALRWVTERLRYTGLELGRGAYIPANAAEVLARGFGDCKDMSTLVVALLREAGVGGPRRAPPQRHGARRGGRPAGPVRLQPRHRVCPGGSAPVAPTPPSLPAASTCCRSGIAGATL